MQRLGGWEGQPLKFHPTVKSAGEAPGLLRTALQQGGVGALGSHRGSQAGKGHAHFALQIYNSALGYERSAGDL